MLSNDLNYLGVAAMSDHENQENTNQNQIEPKIIPQLQYVKDISFECPNSPEVFFLLTQQKLEPQLSVFHDVKVGKLGDEGHAYEVVLAIKIESKDEKQEKSIFVLELVYAGVFHVEAPENLLQPLLFVEVPRLLFPYARQIVSSVTLESGFPPIHLPIIDFLASFKAKVEEAQNSSKEGENQ